MSADVLFIYNLDFLFLAMRKPWIAIKKNVRKMRRRRKRRVLMLV